MGLYQDNYTGLSELERLAAMAHDPVRVLEIGADQWPLTMMACGLMASNDEEKLEENFDIYDIFASRTTVAARRSSLVQLSRFITGRKGEGWKSLVPYATNEPDDALSRKAATYVATLAQPGPEEPLAGVAELVSRLVRDEFCPATLLDAVLSLADMRVLPLLQPVLDLPAERLAELVDDLVTTPNRLSCSFLLRVLEAQPALAAEVAESLCRMAPLAPVIIDLALPIPTWAFEKPTPQPLHGWTPAEYFDRMLPELQPALSAEHLQQVRAAFGAC
ncbi:MAG: hypothetical protein IKA23_05505 [Akkermansia sp.]|nr:hypothetical protein [Akkermansia sp.]MBR2314591.1 hypothetical protein [Akkermansia sp.]